MKNLLEVILSRALLEALKFYLHQLLYFFWKYFKTFKKFPFSIFYQTFSRSCFGNYSISFLKILSEVFFRDFYRGFLWNFLLRSPAINIHRCFCVRKFWQNLFQDCFSRIFTCTSSVGSFSKCALKFYLEIPYQNSSKSFSANSLNRVSKHSSKISSGILLEFPPILLPLSVLLEK